jgi:demethylmenaquinone methyltransferase/2-methoxy-6-polyprenyl-1,4-benzoquinol methylase
MADQRTDWRSYDNIAREYDPVWGRFFQEAARRMWTVAPLPPGAALLDIGTGTGIVPRELGPRTDALARLVGCDRSRVMLQEAASRTPRLRGVAADAERLPMADGVFDVVTASFVLSHLPDYRAGLAEARRVLKPGGAFVASSWAAKTDPQTETWRGLLAEALPASAAPVAALTAEVAPSETFFESEENLPAALSEAGFVDVEVRRFSMSGQLTVEQFLSDRELSSSGRFARQSLGPSEYQQLLDRARGEISRSFGETLRYQRAFLVGLGRRP